MHIAHLNCIDSTHNHVLNFILCQNVWLFYLKELKDLKGINKVKKKEK